MESSTSDGTMGFCSGTWNGFYIEKHNENRGWMHLFLDFEDGKMKGEGTDYVGPWVLEGVYDEQSLKCRWTKKYMGKHTVSYQGELGQNGITGNWSIGGLLNGPFHIWPKQMTHFNEMYMTEDLERQKMSAGSPSILLEGVDRGDYLV